MPIVEVSEDGSFVMTRTPDTGGLVHRTGPSTFSK
ncbi:MAG: hypothetical protein JKY78_03330 [Hyphomonas sp.]|nr:hypothetical protein [Hyphomonas sp.]